MAVLTPVQVSIAGVAQALAAADVAGDSFPNTGRTIFAVKNAGAGPVDLTFDSPKLCDQGFPHDVVVAVANDSVIKLIGPFSVPRFNDANGRVAATYSAVTSLTVAAIEPGS